MAAVPGALVKSVRSIGFRSSESAGEHQDPAENEQFGNCLVCYPPRYLTMGPSGSVAIGGHGIAPPEGFRRGVRCRGDAAVVIGDEGFYSLFSVIADWAAPRSTMALSAA